MPKLVLPHSATAWEETVALLTRSSFSLPVNNNCDPSSVQIGWFPLTLETWFDLSAYRTTDTKKRIAAEKNILYTAKKVGANRCGQLVLTFPRGTSVERAKKAFRKAQELFKKLFVTWVAFLQVSPGGQVHYHLFVVLPEPIEEGFRFDLYRDPLEEALSLHHGPDEMLQYRRQRDRSLTTNPYLRQLWSILRRQLPKYGFGRRFPFQLTPIYAMHHLADYQTKGLQGGARRRVPKGNRAINYARNFPRPWGEYFQVLTPATNRLRQQFAAIGRTFSVDEDGIRRRFGPKWGYWFLKMIEELARRHGEGWLGLPWPPGGLEAALRSVADHFNIRHRLEPSSVDWPPYS